MSASQVKQAVETFQSHPDNCQKCLKQAKENPNTLYEFGRCQYFYPLRSDIPSNIFIGPRRLPPPNFPDFANIPIPSRLKSEKKIVNMTPGEIVIINYKTDLEMSSKNQSLFDKNKLSNTTAAGIKKVHNNLLSEKVAQQSLTPNFPKLGYYIPGQAEREYQEALKKWWWGHNYVYPERKINERRENLLSKGHDNLLLHRGLLDFKAQSQVSSLTSLAVVLFFVIVVFSVFFMWLACSIIAEDVTDRRSTICMFMMVNLIVIVLLLQLANSVWMLYFVNGCYISVVSKPYILLSQALITLFMLMMCMIQCPIRCNHIILGFAVATLVMYTVLSLIMAIINFSHSHRIPVLLFVCLGFLSIFEIPSFIFGFAFYESAFKFMNIDLCREPLPRVPTIPTALSSENISYQFHRCHSVLHPWDNAPNRGT